MYPHNEDHFLYKLDSELWWGLWQRQILKIIRSIENSHPQKKDAEKKYPNHFPGNTAKVA